MFRTFFLIFWVTQKRLEKDPKKSERSLKAEKTGAFDTDGIFFPLPC